MLIFVEGNGGRGENGGESCERVWKEGRGLHQLHHGEEEAGCGEEGEKGQVRVAELTEVLEEPAASKIDGRVLQLREDHHGV